MELSKGLTIVVPVYNRASVVGRTLYSIEHQTLRPLSVILVDNGSSDNTMEVLKEWQNHVMEDIEVSVISEHTPGAAAARNAGLNLVATEWTMFFDSDDEMSPDHCERALSAADGFDIVGWDVEYVLLNGSRATKSFVTGDAQYHNLMHGNLATQRYMARTTLLREVGGWNKDVGYWDDIELGARLLSMRPRIMKVQGAPRVFVYEGEESITGCQFSHRTAGAAMALGLMAATLGPDRWIWIRLKHAVFAADCTREGSEEGLYIFRRLLQEEPTVRGRLLIRFVYHYRRFGGRGAARIIRFLV